MRMNKTLGIVLVALLLASMAMVVVAIPWDGVPDDPTPAQAIWVDPKNTTISPIETFVVDALINVTSPTSAEGTGMNGFEYKFFWNLSLINLTSYTTHIPSGWEPPNGFLVKDETGVWSDGPKDGLAYHWWAYVCMNTTRKFTGVWSLCTYNFSVMEALSPPFNGTLDLQDVHLVDDKAVTFVTDHPTPLGTVQDGMYYVSALPALSVTWKWLDGEKNPVWFDADVTFYGSYPTEFNFNRSLGQVNVNFTSTTPGFCNVSVPKLLMDGAFKVLINNTLVPSILSWSESHTFVYFTYSQGTHNIKIIGETVTRIRGTDLLSICDVNGDGIVDIVDIVTLALRFGWEEDC